VFERVLPAEEYAMFDWDAFANNDPTIVPALLHHIAANDNEMAYVAYGPLVWTERWNDPEWWNDPASTLINVRGWPVHHAHECFAQVGLLYNMMFNRDDMIHSAVNFQGCGLPSEEVWGGADAIDKDKNYTPMNERKANFAWWSIVTDVLHDSLTLCNWVWPMTMSPTAARDYRGDLDLEAKFFKAVTGQDVTTDDLYKAGAKIMTLQRANTVRSMKGADGQMGSIEMRAIHDVYTEWPFTKDPDMAVFTEGTDKMDKDDIQIGLTMLYRCFGWDEEKGCPTVECLEYYDMPDVKEELAGLDRWAEHRKRQDLQKAEDAAVQAEEKAAAEAAAQKEAEEKAAAEAAAEAKAAEEAAAAEAAAQQEAQAQQQQEEKQAGSVYVAASGKGKKYHSNPNCSSMNGTKELSKTEAEKQGYTPCKKCY